MHSVWALGGKFIPTVIERFGAFGDALVGLIKTLTGEAQREPLVDDDYVFSTSSVVPRTSLRSCASRPSSRTRT